MISHDVEPGTVHWVYAHPRRGSFNDRLFRAGVDALGADRTVVTSDLYAQGFDPVLSERDFGAAPATVGGIAERAGEVTERGQSPDDVTAERAKLAASELLVLQFPLWWYGVPAIVKGWFDRVLTSGFAFGDTDPETGAPRRYGDGGLVGRRALVVVTTGDDAGSLGPRGISGDLESLLFPVTHGVLWYVGIGTLDLHVVHDADALEPADADREVKRLERRLRTIDAEQPRPFRRLRDGEYRGTHALRDDVLPGRSDLGIHLGPGRLDR